MLDVASRAGSDKRFAVNEVHESCGEKVRETELEALILMCETLQLLSSLSDETMQNIGTEPKKNARATAFQIEQNWEAV